MASIGERIREIRTASSMPLSGLAKRAGLPADELKAYEDGARDLPARLLAPLAAALRIDPAELLGDECRRLDLPGPDVGGMPALAVALAALAGGLVGFSAGLAL